MIDRIKKSMMLFNAPIQRVYEANRGTIIRTTLLEHTLFKKCCISTFISVLRDPI